MIVEDFKKYPKDSITNIQIKPNSFVNPGKVCSKKHLQDEINI